MFADLTPALAATYVFAAAVLLHLALRFWLALRQMRAVALRRGAVPPRFAQKITLAAHQRAARAARPGSGCTTTRLRPSLPADRLALPTRVSLGGRRPAP